MAALKCPNPSCPFLFDPTQVPPGAILTCPRCGMRFTLGPSPFQPPPATYQTPPPPAPADTVPDAQPIFDEPDPVATADPPRPQAEPALPEASSFRGWLLPLAGAFLLFGGLAFAVVLATILMRGDPDDNGTGAETTAPGGTKSTAHAGPEIVYTSQIGKYRLSNYEKIWEKPLAEPRDEDPNGDLLLKGTFRRAGQSRMNLLSTAKLVVIVLVKSGDTEEAVRYVKRRYEIEGSKDIAPTDFTEITGEPLGEAPPGEVKAHAPITRLKVRPGGATADPASEKLVVYSVIKVGDDVVLAEGSCSWSEREVWEQRLIQLVGSLRP